MVEESKTAAAQAITVTKDVDSEEEKKEAEPNESAKLIADTKAQLAAHEPGSMLAELDASIAAFKRKMDMMQIQVIGSLGRATRADPKEVRKLQQQIRDSWKGQGKVAPRSSSTKANRPTVANVGKALSLEHATRMIEHAEINTVMSKQARLRAVGSESDFPEDAMAKYLTRYAEEIFEPKRVLSDGDWLKRFREPDQRFEYYKNGNGNIKWVSPTKNKIYLFIADKSSFTDEQIAKYRLYCSAFFHGMASIEILRAGAKIPG